MKRNADNTQVIYTLAIACAVCLGFACAVPTPQNSDVDGARAALCANGWTVTNTLPVAYTLRKNDERINLGDGSPFVWDISGAGDTGEAFKVTIQGEPVAFEINDEGQPVSAPDADGKQFVVSTIPNLLNLTLESSLIVGPAEEGGVGCAESSACNTESCMEIGVANNGRGLIHWQNVAVNGGPSTEELNGMDSDAKVTFSHRFQARVLLDYTSLVNKLRAEHEAGNTSFNPCSQTTDPANPLDPNFYGRIPTTITVDLSAYSPLPSVAVTVQPDTSAPSNYLEPFLQIIDTDAGNQTCQGNAPTFSVHFAQHPTAGAQFAEDLLLFTERAGVQNALVRLSDELQVLAAEASEDGLLTEEENAVVTAQVEDPANPPLHEAIHDEQPVVAQVVQTSNGVANAANALDKVDEEVADGLLRDRVSGTENAPSEENDEGADSSGSDSGDTGASDSSSSSSASTAVAGSCEKDRVWPLQGGQSFNPDGLPTSCHADSTECEFVASSADPSKGFKPVVAGYYTQGERFRAAYDIELNANVTQVCRKLGTTWVWQNVNLYPREPKLCGSYPVDPETIDGVPRPECSNGAKCGMWHGEYCAQ